MSIHAILHADFEPLGAIEKWAVAQGHTVSISRPYDKDPLTEVTSFDFLIVMGGPQSWVEVNKYPYLAYEITLIKEAIKEKKIILGVCLGAQLIGEAFGVNPEL